MEDAQGSRIEMQQVGNGARGKPGLVTDVSASVVRGGNVFMAWSPSPFGNATSYVILGAITGQAS